MKKFWVVILLLFSCSGPQIENDRTPMTDSEARFESVMTQIGSDYHYGNGVFIIGNLVSPKFFKIHTAFQGEWHLQGCGMNIEGRYQQSQIVNISLNRIFADSEEEKTCTLTIQVSPQVEDSEVTLHPRYSIVTVVLSNRDFNKSIKDRIRANDSLRDITLKPEDNGSYQVVRKCTYETSASFLGRFGHNGVIELNEDFLSDGLIQPISERIGSCYFSILYSDSKGTTRVGYSLSVYDSSHTPLNLAVVSSEGKLSVEGPPTMYICGIENQSEIKSSKCSIDQGSLPNRFIIQGHTNKRSVYLLRSRNE